MGKTYIAPIAEFEEIELDGDLMANSQPTTQCNCYEFIEHGGCRGCHGHCGCNHWDGEKIVPGC